MPFQWARIKPFGGFADEDLWNTPKWCPFIEWRFKRSPRCPEIIWLFSAWVLGAAVVAMFWLLNLDVARHRNSEDNHHHMPFHRFGKIAGSIYGVLLPILTICWFFLPHVRIGNSKCRMVIGVLFKVLELGSVSFIGGFFRHPLHVYCWLLVVVSAFDATLMKIVSPNYDFCGPSIILGISVTVSFDKKLHDLPFPFFILLASFVIIGAVVIMENFEKRDDVKLRAGIAAAAVVNPNQNLNNAGL